MTPVGVVVTTRGRERVKGQTDEKLNLSLRYLAKKSLLMKQNIFMYLYIYRVFHAVPLGRDLNTDTAACR